MEEDKVEGKSNDGQSWSSGVNALHVQPENKNGESEHRPLLWIQVNQQWRNGNGSNTSNGSTRNNGMYQNQYASSSRSNLASTPTYSYPPISGIPTALFPIASASSTIPAYEPEDAISKLNVHDVITRMRYYRRFERPISLGSMVELLNILWESEDDEYPM